MKFPHFIIILLLIFNHNIHGQSPTEPWKPIADQHYQRLNSQSDNKSSPPEIKFYFWPGSPSCYQFELALQDWHLNHPEVKLLRIPLIKRPHWRLLAKAWLVAVKLNNADFFLSSLYQAIHEHSLSITSKPELEQFIISLKLDSKEFMSEFSSRSINQQLKLLQKQAHLFPISGVPTIIINNQWRSDASMAKTSAQLIGVIDQLLTKVEIEQ